MKTIDIDMKNGHVNYAYELAVELTAHCKMYDLDKRLVLDGVAIDAESFLKYQASAEDASS